MHSCELYTFVSVVLLLSLSQTSVARNLRPHSLQTYSRHGLLYRNDDPKPMSPPPWQLTKNTCDASKEKKTDEIWQFYDGNDSLKDFIDFYNNDKILCESCLGLTKDQCKNKSEDCASGLKDLAVDKDSNPIWSFALGRFVGLSDTLICDISNNGCQDLPCSDFSGSSGYVLYRSVANLSRMFAGISSAIKNARDTVGDQANRFTKVLAPLPDYREDRLFFAATTSILEGAVGLVPVVGASASALLGVLSAVGMAAWTNSLKTVPGDGLGELGLIADNMRDSLTDMSNQLFDNGVYKWDGGSTNLADMLMDGKMMTSIVDLEGSYWSNMTLGIEQTMYQQLGVFVWSFWESDDCVHHPFITFADKPCDQLDYKDPKSVPITGIGLDKLDVNITMDGKCYWLLDACPREYESSISGQHNWYSSCSLIRSLPGGTNHDLQSNNFSGLGLEHFISPSVKGWQQNKNTNGFPIASIANGTLDPMRPGGANISVCDYLSVNATQGLPGIGCPLINKQLGSHDAKECELQAPNSIPDPPGVFMPGSCKLHVQQFQRNEQVDMNPLDQYQVYIVVTDDYNRPIGSAAKEEVPGVVIVWDTALPYDILVRPGPNDNDGFEFWYSDQYWTSDDKSPQHNCNVGKYDQGNRQMDCAFDCPMPTKGQQPPPSATIGHLLPKMYPVQSGVPVTEYVNTFKPTPTKQPLSDAGASYPGGQCQIHLIQYDKGTQGWNDDYMVEVYLNFNAKQKSQPTAFAQMENGQVPVKPNELFPVYGLRSSMNITLADNRDDPVVFMFDDGQNIVTWKSNDQGKEHACYSTGFDQGHRDIYCDFGCP